MSNARRYLLWGVAALGVPVLFIALTLSINHRGQITDAIRVGRLFYDRPGVADLTRRARPSPRSEFGFDGQFFYFQTFDPLLRRVAAWQALDAPHLRARRIGYPLLARLLAQARRRIPMGLLAAQLLGLAAILAMIQIACRERGWSPLHGFLLAASLPVLVPIEYMTCETVAAAWVMAAFFFHERGRSGACWSCVAAACLTKEICVLAAFGLMLDMASRGRWKRAAVYAASLLPLAAWIAYLRWRIPVDPSLAGDLRNLDWPLAGALDACVADWRAWLAGERPANQLVRALGIAWFVGGAAIAWIRLARGPSAAAWCAAGAGCLAVLLTNTPVRNYEYILNYGRQLALLPAALAADYFFASRPESPRSRRVMTAWLAAGLALGLFWA